MLRLSDQLLVKRAQGGDDVAFCVLVERYRDGVIRYLNRVVRDYHVAQDLSQETFVRAHASLQRLGSPHRFHVWLFRIAYHIGIDHLRSRPSPATRIEDIGDCVSTDEAHPLHGSSILNADHDQILGSTFGGIASVLAELPLPYRAVMVHRYLEGRDCQQLASRMGWSVANVKVRLHRGRRIVRRQLRSLERRLRAELEPLRDGYFSPKETARVRIKF